MLHVWGLIGVYKCLRGALIDAQGPRGGGAKEKLEQPNGTYSGNKMGTNGPKITSLSVSTMSDSSTKSLPASKISSSVADLFRSNLPVPGSMDGLTASRRALAFFFSRPKHGHPKIAKTQRMKETLDVFGRRHLETRSTKRRRPQSRPARIQSYA